MRATDNGRLARSLGDRVELQDNGVLRPALQWGPSKLHREGCRNVSQQSTEKISESASQQQKHSLNEEMTQRGALSLKKISRRTSRRPRHVSEEQEGALRSLARSRTWRRTSEQ